MSFLFRFHDLIGGVYVPIDDGVDKLNRKYTLIVFLFLALPIITKQYIRDPIECFTPTYFTDSQARYVNSFCWTASTYYIVSDEDIEEIEEPYEPPDPRVIPEELDYAGFELAASQGKLRRVQVGYYQWAPLILLVQGCCFYLPFIFWCSTAHNSGINLRRLLNRASEIASLPPGCPQRESLLTEFIEQFHNLVGGSSGCCADPSCRLPLFCRLAMACRCLGRPGRYLSLLYLLVKAMYVLNVGVQFLLLTAFMGRGFLRHGVELVRRLTADGNWWNSPRFPLQTLCQVRAAIQGGLRTYTCQCVLPINVYNEKIFSVVWFYLALLLPVNTISLVLWVWRCLPCNRLAFVRLCLWRTKQINMSELARVARKISVNYLGWDGFLVLRLVEHNHGSTLATVIIGKLWEFYTNQMKAQEEGNSDVEMVNLAAVPPAPQPQWHVCHNTSCHIEHNFHGSRAGSSGYWAKCH